MSTALRNAWIVTAFGAVFVVLGVVEVYGVFDLELPRGVSWLITGYLLYVVGFRMYIRARHEQADLESTSTPQPARTRRPRAEPQPHEERQPYVAASMLPGSPRDLPYGMKIAGSIGIPAIALIVSVIGLFVGK
jgi:hypothetical protein